MQHLHAGAEPVDEDEGVALHHVHPHLVPHYAAQRVEALAHVGREGIEEEAVGVTQGKHGGLS